MEPMKEPNYKTMAAVLWVALITAIVVTIIDWKIKSDILRLTDAFYRVYPSTLENQHEQKFPVQTPAESPRRTDSDRVPRFSVVDSNSGVEEENAASPAGRDPEDHSGNWAEFAPHIDTGLQSGTTSDS